MKILLHGCNGKMGRVMTRIISAETDMDIVCGVDKAPLESGKQAAAYPVYRFLDHVKESPEIIIDFSHHSCLDDLLAFSLSRNVPLVVCTTGFSQEQRQKMNRTAEAVPLLHSANMSLGINLLLSLSAKAAGSLHDTFDIEIVEKHHNQKVDSPSGTALLIADAVVQSIDGPVDFVYGRHSKTRKRSKTEIGIHAIRGGAVVGEHTVIFAGQGEVFELTHSALSRDVFAHGAVKAARFLAQQGPGLYSMKDVVASR